MKRPGAQRTRQIRCPVTLAPMRSPGSARKGPGNHVPYQAGIKRRQATTPRLIPDYSRTKRVRMSPMDEFIGMDGHNHQQRENVHEDWQLRKLWQHAKSRGFNSSIEGNHIQLTPSLQWNATSARLSPRHLCTSSIDNSLKACESEA
jgi:hypothetical protein